MDISNLGDMIRWPFEMIGTIIYFLIKYLIPIAIIIGSIYLIYFIFSRGIIQKISERIILAKTKKMEDESN